MRKTLYINDQTALSHLELQPNQSKFVEQLILNHLNQEQSKLTSKDEIIKLVQEYLLSHLSNNQQLIQSQLSNYHKLDQLNQNQDIIPDIMISVDNVLNSILESK